MKLFLIDGAKEKARRWAGLARVFGLFFTPSPSMHARLR
jgi:hypothetical protein